MYDLLSAFRNVHWHRWLRPKKVRRVEPGLRDRDLVGAALYYDAWNGTPWLPILLQYDVQFTPVKYLDPNGSHSTLSYPP